MKELFYRDEYDAKLNKACFESLGTYTEDSLKEAILAQRDKVKVQFVRLFKDLKIDLVIPNNLLCLGRSPYIAMALTDAIIETGVDVIGHHHDFYWERDYFKAPTTGYVAHLLEDYFPPKQLTDMRHVVINTPAKHDLLERKRMNAKVIPNVFDFEMARWVEDEFNESYKTDMGITDNQVVFLQATRVTNRKAIELAIDLIAVLNEPYYQMQLVGKTLYNGKVYQEDSELVLALVGLHEGLEGYEDMLIDHADALGVNMIVNPDIVSHKRHYHHSHKIYSLWDAYVYCDMITYPSIYEGWGNQFLEGLFAKRPQIVFEYSIFESDISAYGFDYISLGNTYEVDDRGLARIGREKLQAAADETITYLLDAKLYVESCRKNFIIGKEHLSLDALEAMVMALF